MVLRKVQDVSLEAMALGEVEVGKREEELLLLLLITGMAMDKDMEKAVVSLHRRRRRRREVNIVKIIDYSAVVSYYFSCRLGTWWMDTRLDSSTA
jgi:hypothetical protein